MPRLYFTGLQVQPVMISTDNSVGKGCTNQRNDVLLVQFMMRVVNESPANSNWWQKKEKRPLTIDGTCGEVTQSFIRLMQGQVGGVTEDGRIDPIINARKFTKTGMVKTMIKLNGAYMNATGNNNMASMQFHPLWPQELNAELQLRR